MHVCIVVTYFMHIYFFLLFTFWKLLFVACTLLPHAHTYALLLAHVCMCTFLMASARQLHSNASFRRFFLNFKYVKRLFYYLYFVIYLFYIFLLSIFDLMAMALGCVCLKRVSCRDCLCVWGTCVRFRASAAFNAH